MRLAGATGAVAGIAVWSAVLVPAAAAESLSLPEAVQRALRANPAVLQARAQAEAAAAAAREAAGARGPALELRETALRTDAPADAFGLRLMQETFAFPEFVAGDPNHPAPVNNFATEIQATMPLFTGGKLGAGIRAARLFGTAAAAGSRQAEAAVALQTATAYLQALLADRGVELATQAQRTTQRHVEQAQDFFDAGMLVESELLQARVQEARMEEQRLQAENNARLARAGLARLVGADQGTVFELDPDPAPLAPDSTALDGAIRAALATRHDLAAGAAANEAAAAGVQRARGELWPELALSAKYAWNDEQPLGFHGESYTVFALARWTPWNWGQTQARVARSRAQQTAAEQALRDGRAQAEFEVREAWQAVGTAQARRRAADRARAAAERAALILDDRFTQGVARMTDLLDAETQAHEARVREAQADFELQRAIRTVRFVTGVNPVPEAAAERATP